MKALIPGFAGLNKLLAPQRIEETQATVAVDVDFRSGDLKGFASDVALTASTSVASAQAKVSLFEYASGKTILLPSAESFVRSPVLNDANNRVYYTRAGARPGTVDASTVLSGSVPQSVKSLGVPQPAKPGMPNFVVQAGALAAYSFGTVATAQVQVLSSLVASARLSNGDKLSLEAAGFDPVKAYTLSAMAAGATTTTFDLKADKRVWKTARIWLELGSTAFIVKCPNHGLMDGDQVVFSHTASNKTAMPTLKSGGPSPIGQVSQVLNATVDTFELMVSVSGDWTPVELAAKPTGKARAFATGKKFVRVALADSAFEADALPSVALTTSGKNNTVYQVTLSVADATATAATWANADTLELARDRAYLSTFVNAYGEEGPPSQATESLNLLPKNPVTFPAGFFSLSTSSDAVLMPVAEFPAVSKVRLYRTDESGAWRFVADIANTAAAFVDTLADAELGEVLPSVGWWPAPSGLRGLTLAPNGVLVGFVGKTLHASLPFIPYAWPTEHQFSVDAPIVGLVQTAAGLAVLTEQQPFLVSGSDPGNWSISKLESPLACVSAQSIVDMGAFGVYASADGLVSVSGASVQLLTKDVLSRAQWQAYNPGSIIGGFAEGRYVGSYIPLDAPTTRLGFIFDAVTGTFCDASLSFVATFTDLSSDTLEFVQWGGAASGRVHQWARGSSTKAYQWRSKLFQAPLPINFGAAQVLMTSYVNSDVTCQVWLGGVPLFRDASGNSVPVPVSSADPFRLPSGYLAKDYQVEIKGSGWVQAAALASVMSELKEAP